MKKLFENWRVFINEDVDSRPKSISHSWITHGHSVGTPHRIGEVLKHTLTENGKIEYYKVKFDDGIEILKEDEFVGVTIQEHTHESVPEEDMEEDLEEQWPDDLPSRRAGFSKTL